MAPYYSLYIRRSDGRTEVRSTQGIKAEPNEPIPEQLNQTPNAQGIADFYRECKFGETKEIDWRRKLAGMLVRELGSSEGRDRNYILAAMPENYRLFEHVKCKVSAEDGKPVKVAKNHAAGPNERQDAYLYGHPIGRKKRYRSPAEFFPHLLWLATDESGNPDNCSCKFCSPEELEDDKTQSTKAKETKQQEMANKVQVSTAAKPSTPAAMPTPAPPRQTPVPAAAPFQIPLTPLPRFRSLEQKADTEYKKAIYRNGEIVWFSRGSAWGLGVVVKRQVGETQSVPAQYRVQPLSHPHFVPPQQLRPPEQLRPWLAWSPPSCTCPGLNPNPANPTVAPTYNNVDWQGVVAGRYGPGDAEVDGSILAVKKAETTFTPFDPLPVGPSANPGDAHYNGIFIGGEKIWVGDALRLRKSDDPTDIMVLHNILERSNPKDKARPFITLIGDSYSFRKVQHEPHAVPKDNLHLPARVRKDLDARNEIASKATDPKMTGQYFWRLQRKSAHLTIADIKGRWYESSILGPILDGARWTQNCITGNVIDIGMIMNGQGDCNKITMDTAQGRQQMLRPADVKVSSREEAFGAALPPNLHISRGLDETRPGSSGGQKPQQQAVQPQGHMNFSAQPQARPQPQTQPQWGNAPQAQSEMQYASGLPQAQHRQAQPQLQQPNPAQQRQWTDSPIPAPQQQQQQHHHPTSQPTSYGGTPQPGFGAAGDAASGFDSFMDFESDAMVPGFGQDYGNHDINGGLWGHDGME